MNITDRFLACFCCFCVTVFAASPVFAAPKKVKKQTSPLLTTKQVIQRVLPSVVRLTVLNQDGVPAVQGSGIVVGDDLIATNVHVVDGGHAVTANFENGRSEAVFGVVGADFDHDLVLLRAFTHGVPSLPLADSSSAEVGDPVLAIGSPEGLGGSVSTGIISGIRMYKGSKVIQTTAPISHGSSGGCLVNMRGQVIGITSFFNTEGQNINFAYPSYYLRQTILHQFKELLTWKYIEDYVRQHPSPVPAAKTGSATGGSNTAAADTTEITETPLVGVQEVKVTIGDIAADAQQDGLDADALKVAMKARLRRAGIPVVDDFSSDTSKPGLSLYLLIDTLNDADKTSYVYSLELAGSEYVTIYRPLPLTALAYTWRTGDYGIVGKAKLTQLNDIINNMTDKFAEDFLVQNPPKK